MIWRHLGNYQRAHRLVNIRAKTLAGRRQAEAPVSVGTKHTDSSNTAKEPIKGCWTSSDNIGQLGCGAGTVRELVGNSEARHGGDGLSGPHACDES
jgi:hypothetical protein